MRIIGTLRVTGGGMLTRVRVIRQIMVIGVVVLGLLGLLGLVEHIHT